VSAPGSARLAGVDVGGTAIKLGVLRADGSERRESSIDVEPGWPAARAFGAVANALRELAPGLTSVGVGLPGLLDRASGRVPRSPNLPWLENAPVTEILAAELGIPREQVRVENDANVAALGEQWLGAARGVQNLLLLTLGTGIGGGLVLDGELFTGEGLAGEVGHLSIDPEGPECPCGSRGCLERLASASAAARRARERGLPSEAPGDLEVLSERARDRAGPERDLLREVGRDLGRGLAQVATLLDVRTFLFGGGFSAALDVLEPGIREALATGVYGRPPEAIRLARAGLGPSAGWIGAARLALGRSAVR
jgi:glucokinase